MVRKDKQAAEYIRRLRTAEGLSPEALGAAITQKGTQAGFPASRVHVSGDTIRLVERTHHEPGVRVKFAIALYFDLTPGAIWHRDELAGTTSRHVLA